MRPNDSGAHSPEGRIEVAELTKGSAQRPRYAHSLMQVLSFLREA